MSKTGSGRGRTRNWTCIVYPESAPENWRDIINAEHIAWIESPLHEGELNPDSEGEKKSHWHVILTFEGVKNFEQVMMITEKLNGTIPQKVASVVGLVRYMVHLDNPEKKQYSVADIVAHGGADVMALLRPSSSTRYELIAEMQQWVDDNHCFVFADLCAYARTERTYDWHPLLCDNSTVIMREYIKSRSWQHYTEGKV